MILLPPDSYVIKNYEHKGRGVEATADILPGTVIGDYLGRITSLEQIPDKPNGLYDMWIYEDYTVLPDDVSAPGIHIINHSCMPNCAMFPYEGHILYFALRHIHKHEELTVHYSMCPHEADQPCYHMCYCNTVLCTGSMHVSTNTCDIWCNYVTHKQAPYTEKYQLDTILTPLPHYPDQITDNGSYDIFGDTSLPAAELDLPHLPDASVIRSTIRSTGRILHLAAAKLLVYGIRNDIICIKNTEPYVSS